MSYMNEAMSDAQETARNFSDEILEQFMDDGKASTDLLNDYAGGDEYHHENHTDKAYDLKEAAEILDELSDYEETDSGLWEGLKPREAISAQAAYTYANAVYGQWQNLMEAINDDSELEDLYDSYNGIEDEVSDELTEHREDAEEGDEFNDENDNFDPDAYQPPFDETEEVEKRQAETKAKIAARITALVDGFA